MSRICAIILAAGESKRMGTNKLMLTFRGQPMINHVIDHARQQAIETVLVVLGAFRDEMLPLLDAKQVSHCYNSEFKQGMLSSVQCGFQHLPAGMDAVILFLGDQPMMPPEVASLLLAAYDQSRKGIVVPVYRDKRGHPVVIDLKYRQVIAKLNPDEGLHALLRLYESDVLEINMDRPEILRDIDDAYDYKHELTIK